MDRTKRVACWISPAPERDTAKEFDEAFRTALARLSQNQSHFSETDILRATAEEAQGRGLWAARVCEGVARELVHNRELVALGEQCGEKRYTTRENLELEKRLLARVEASRQDESHFVTAHTVTEVLSRRPTMTDEQSEALIHLTRRTGSVQVVTGMAGTGKSYMLDAAREAWEADGFKVIGAALAGKAAQGLEASAHIRSATIHKTLADIDGGRLQLRPKTVLVIDEAGMVPTRLMERLTDHVERAGAKLVLVGDAGQLQPVEAGGPFARSRNGSAMPNSRTSSASAKIGAFGRPRIRPW